MVLEGKKSKETKCTLKNKEVNTSLGVPYCPTVHQSCSDWQRNAISRRSHLSSVSWRRISKDVCKGLEEERRLISAPEAAALRLFSFLLFKMDFFPSSFPSIYSQLAFQTVNRVRMQLRLYFSPLLASEPGLSATPYLTEVRFHCLIFSPEQHN